MKHILAENMRRIGTKNLTEQHVDRSTETVGDLDYFMKNPEGTVETVNRKFTKLNNLPVDSNTKFATSVITSYDMTSDKRLYGTKTWSYTFKNNKFNFVDDKGYTAWTRNPENA